MNIKHDLTLQKFGRLIALEPIGKNNKRYVVWKCQCECGNIANVIGSCLRSGNTKSCGCLQRDTASALRLKYPNTNYRLLRTWHNMHNRCKSPNAASYHRYGGRGISVCKEWNDYLAFEKWALTHGYSDSLTIDRIDNDKSYSPGNCRWATMKEQAQNRSISTKREIFQ